MKKRTILLALLFAATGLSPLQAQKKYKAYIVSNSHLDTQWNWDVQTTIPQAYTGQKLLSVSALSQLCI